MDRVGETTETDLGQKLELVEPKEVKTPIFDAILERANTLSELSNYKSNFNWETYKELELRYIDDKPFGGIIFKSAFKLVNAHTTCQQCLYAFEVDTYGRGCIHDCVYCYAKHQLESHGSWNRPIPFPVDISDIWKTFYTVFETDKRSKWREVLSKRVPIRIGSMSDSFMWMDRKYKVTLEFLKLLKHYNYPHIIFTRSDLVAHDDYLRVLDPNLASVQMSISSTNDKLNKLIEPGAPSAERRLKALQKLNQNGFWTTVRINPLFPIYPDGFFTNPNFDHSIDVPKFDYFNFEMIDQIADHGVQSLLTGFVRLSGQALKGISEATNMDLKPFFGAKKFERSSNYHYSDAEIRFYYEQIKERANIKGVEFTTCYIGNGESHFWKDQDLWDNKSDCCNAKGRIDSFKSDSRLINWDERMKHFSLKSLVPNDLERLHAPLGDDFIKPIKLMSTGPQLVEGSLL
jgi:DNA repair photolyase